MRYQNDINSDVSNYTKEQKDILLYSSNRNWGVPVFKIDNFVGNAQYTPFGKLRQFMLEIKSREDSIMELEFKVEKLGYEIELEQEYISLTDSPAQKKIHELNIREKQRNIINAKTLLTMTYEERDKFMMLITRFNESEDGKLSDGRLIMDIIGDHDEEERLEEELWAVRLGSQAAWDILFYGKVNGGNMEAIHQLPPRTKQKAIEVAVERAITTNSQFELTQKEVVERLQLSPVFAEQKQEIESNWEEIDFNK